MTTVALGSIKSLTGFVLSLLAVTTSVCATPTPVDNFPTTLQVVARSPPTKLPSTIKGFPPKDWKCKLTQKNDKSQHRPKASLCRYQQLSAQTFDSDYIKRSVEYGLQLRDNGDNKAGSSKYPGWLKAPKSIEGLEDYKGETNVDHFPLTHDGKTVFVGGTQKPTSDARVVYQHTIGSDEAIFIGVWTHAGRKDGKFEKCEEV
ncbi:hypothetical protein HBI56_235510 [Parastagonospora nodorum]|nr:hypothetical protein HBH53_243060 [Parastagonospora nodorum]KAH3963550.1 hypothetical protein HBH52_218310 [Parastagonospora nodorum]KAH3990985.1 hypothetical protein HBI10_239430 [Parastagonospora nodorum]KAH4008224.1 hypothetical protein HBI13_238980 [Parastagonospora nodorum]KAH4010934.1 hypothetical protein HBI09_229240 [Parastagonospora nodorum]